MIPLHRPSYGIGTILAASLSGGESKSVRRLEEAYAEATACPGVVWLPSARAGMGWALKISVGPETKVVGPAFTCSVVHEAMRRSGGIVHLLDAADDDFLLPPGSLAAFQKDNHALVLCELYGHAYDLTGIAKAAARAPAVRVIDLAMAVPHRSLFQRLQKSDFAVLSFGAGKSMYAGWGAMGFTPNLSLANEVRKIRDATLARGSFSLPWRRMIETAARAVGSHPRVFALAKKLRDRLRGNTSASVAASESSVSPTDGVATTPEWRLPSTHLDRGLALWNLQHAPHSCERRLALASEYHRRLKDVKELICPKNSTDVLSHYTVRIAAESRSAVKQRLYQSGVDTVTLWGFPAYLDKDKFPRAFRLSSEVLNLPLSPWMSARHVEFVCRELIRALREDASKSREA